MAKRIMPSLSTLISFGAATCVATLMNCVAWAQPTAEISEHLRPPSAFSGIIDRAARSRALFAEAAKVITSPRCMNCHPAGDHPAQGNDEHVHQPAATRGEAGVGIPGLVCAACTQSRFAPRAYGEGRLGGLGMASWSGPSAGSGDPGRIWCDRSGVDRQWGGMSLTGAPGLECHAKTTLPHSSMLTDDVADGHGSACHGAGKRRRPTSISSDETNGSRDGYSAGAT
jgi:hypothetical protein